MIFYKLKIPGKLLFKSLLFRPDEKYGGILYSGVLVFSFSTQNQVPQIIIGMG